MSDPIDYAKLTAHPLASIFPRMGKEEMTELVADIRKNGMLERITLYEGKILDGNNRYVAAGVIGLKLTEANFRQLPDGVDPWDFVVSENIQRRHLSQDQKREVIEALVKADPTKSNRAIAAVAKVDKNTVKTVRDGLEATGEIHQLEETIGKDGKKRKMAKTGTKKKTPKKIEPHVAYKAKQEELIDLLKETHTSHSQAVEWADNTKRRLDETVASIGKELDDQNEKEATPLAPAA
jgi:hypothetical protein